MFCFVALFVALKLGLAVTPCGKLAIVNLFKFPLLSHASTCGLNLCPWITSYNTGAFSLAVVADNSVF